MESLSKARKSSKRSKSKSKSKSTTKSASSKTKTRTSTSGTRRRRSSSSFDTLTDCHKALLKIALRKGLYPEVKTDFESANFSKVIDFVHKHISRKADKAITRIYQAIEKKSNKNSKLSRSASRGRMDGGGEVAQSSA